MSRARVLALLTLALSAPHCLGGQAAASDSSPVVDRSAGDATTDLPAASARLAQSAVATRNLRWLHMGVDATMGQTEPSGAAVRDLAITVDSRTVGMGRSVSIQARASDQNGKPVSGVMLYPFVNRKRWGAHELTDAGGQAVF